MSYFDLFALFGIGLEIWGFIWILKFNRIQKASEFVNWILRQGYSENWVSEIPRERTMIMENDLEHDFHSGELIGNQGWTVPKEYYDYCERRRKWSIALVVIGLTGQILQILSVDLFQFSPPT